jgi:hypothetical protein
LSTAVICQKGTVISVNLPNGSLISIAASYGSAITVTALTNANPAVATATAHGLSNGDVIEVTSGWARLNDKVVRVANVTTNTFELEGINTTSTTSYPAGSGTGSVRELLTFTQLAQVLSVTSSGGEQQFATYQFLETDFQNRIPTIKNAQGLTLSVADDPTLAGYTLLSTANDDRAKRGVKVTLSSGALIFYNAYISLNRTPSLTVNEVMASEATLSFLNEPVRYSS